MNMTLGAPERNNLIFCGTTTSRDVEKTAAAIAGIERNSIPSSLPNALPSFTRVSHALCMPVRVALSHMRSDTKSIADPFSSLPYGQESA